MPTENQQDLEHFERLLRQHPDVFNQRPELLDLLELKDARGVSSLLERQVQRLQTTIFDLHARHAELVDVASDNYGILSKLDDVLSRLLVYRSLSEFYADFPRALREVFDIDQVSLKTPETVALKPSDKQQYKEVVRRVSGKSAVCDNRWPTAVNDFFFNPRVESAALVPLLSASKEEVLGVLALGSADPERYAPELGSAHLNRIGLLGGLCLARLSLDAP